MKTAPPDTPGSLRIFAIFYLAIEAVGATLWWFFLWRFPAVRELFVPPAVPQNVFFALALPDAILFIGAAALCAWSMARKSTWAWPLLCVHGGAAIYAALLAVSLCFCGGGAWLGASLMAPCLVVLPFFVWKLRPAPRD